MGSQSVSWRDEARATGHRMLDNHRMLRRSRPRTHFWANREADCAREANFRPPQTRSLGARGEVCGGQRCVTPRQTCPRPNGFRRNLRSKTRWFTGFCNSHQVSHFATFFIDARAEISVAESRSLYSYRSRGDHRGRVTVSGASMAGIVRLSFLDAFRAGVRLVPGTRGGATRTRRGGSGACSRPSPPSGVVTCSRVFLLGRSRQ